MPILDPSYISSWYFFADNGGPTNGQYRLFETWSENQRVETEKKGMLQGDIGTHVLHVGGQVWETTVSSPVLIFDTVDFPNGPQILDIFDLLLDAFHTIQSPTLLTSALYLLKDATISIDENGTDVDCTFLSDKGMATDQGVFAAISPTSLTNPGYQDFIARTATFYDTVLYLSNDFTDPYQILSGKVHIEVDVKERYFLNQGQKVWLSPQGYHISGDMSVLGLPTGEAYQNGDIRLNIPEQGFGNFNTTHFTPTALQIGDVSLTFGNAALTSNIKRNLSVDGVSQMDLHFEGYVRYQPPV